MRLLALGVVPMGPSYGHRAAPRAVGPGEAYDAHDEAEELWFHELALGPAVD